jgi:hypothetical protein
LCFYRESLDVVGIEFSSLRGRTARRGNAGICHSFQLNRQVCAVWRRVHPLQTISWRRLVATLFKKGFQPGCSAGVSASASGLAHCRCSDLVHTVAGLSWRKVGCRVILDGERVLGEVNTRLPVLSTSNLLAGRRQAVMGAVTNISAFLHIFHLYTDCDQR